jgi:hypothetical protein
VTPGRYRITVSGLIGPTLASAFPGFSSEAVVRHHVLLIRDDTEGRLLAVLDRLYRRGITVDQVVARYR